VGGMCSKIVDVKVKASVFMSKKHNKKGSMPPSVFLVYFAPFDIKKAASFFNETAFLLQK
jgi:hypothetical protein